jgi:phosphatidylglycerophosphate synthase
MNVVQSLVHEGGAVKLANLITLARLLSIFPIMLLLATDHGQMALELYIAAALTDFLDGWLARRSARASDFGARLDGVVDNIFSIALLPFLLLAFPGLFLRHPLALIVLFAGPLLYLLVAKLWTGSLMMFHFHSAKLGAALLFALWPVIWITGWEGFIPLAAFVVASSRIEQLIFIWRGGTAQDAPHAFVALDPA